MHQDVVAVSFVEEGTSLWQDALRRLRKNRLAMYGAYVLLFMIALAVATPWIAPFTYDGQNLELGATAPSLKHWLGTDVLGRDQLTRVMYGSRISLMVGFIATSVAIFIGVLWGATAGFVGGAVDTVMMRTVDV